MRKCTKMRQQKITESSCLCVLLFAQMQRWLLNAVQNFPDYMIGKDFTSQIICEGIRPTDIWYLSYYVSELVCTNNRHLESCLNWNLIVKWVKIAGLISLKGIRSIVKWYLSYFSHREIGIRKEFKAFLRWFCGNDVEELTGVTEILDMFIPSTQNSLIKLIDYCMR